MADHVSEEYEEDFDIAHIRTSFSENIDSNHKLGRSRSKSPSKHAQGQINDQPLGTQKLQLTEHALRENGNGVDTLNDSVDSLHYSDDGNDSMSMAGGTLGYADGADDTCFSTFSAVPNADMTLFAQTARSSTKDRPTTPTRSSRPTSPSHTTPGTIRAKRYSSESPSPSTNQRNSEDTTNLMLDFTEQFNFRRPSPKKYHTQPNLSDSTSDLRKRSPQKHRVPATPSEARLVANLLDFDIPPAPTPRSIPSVTAHEVETMKSGFLSQISSLRATLSGKDAEAKSLKEAVKDAERRAGQALEETRINRQAKESLQTEKLEWEKRDKEMQTVLRSAKEEIVLGQRDRDTLTQKLLEAESKLSEAEKKREEAENRTAEAESKVAGLEASVISTPAPTGSNNVSTPGSSTTKAVEVAVERVARELHALYKTKHENKVLALKKSYEARWEKRIRELQQKVDEVTKENEELRIARDATMSGVIPPLSMTAQVEKEKELREEEDKQEARFAELESVLETLKRENGDLIQQIEKERTEKGELVAAAEEMLSMQMQLTAASNAPLPPSPQSSHTRSNSSTYARPPSASSSETHTAATTTSSTVTTNSLRGNTLASTRPTGLKGPGFAGGMGESRIGMGMMKKNGSVNAAAGGRSGIMGNIERMGKGVQRPGTGMGMGTGHANHD